MSGFRIGDTVCIRKGAFANFTGVVQEVDTERCSLKVVVDVFGRNASVVVLMIEVKKVEKTPPRRPDVTNLN
jgi:transcription termination/antitermination protein NusG